MTTKFMTDPIRILVKRDELTLEGIKQANAPAAVAVVFRSNSCGAVLCFGRARRLEVRHSLRPVSLHLACLWRSCLTRAAATTR